MKMHPGKLCTACASQVFQTVTEEDLSEVRSDL
jgi:hypothetical protein